MSYTEKLRRRLQGKLAGTLLPGEELVAAVRCRREGAGQRITGALGSGGPAAAVIRTLAGDGPLAADQDLRSAPRAQWGTSTMMTVAVTSRRLLVLRNSELWGTARDVLAEIPLARLREVTLYRAGITDVLALWLDDGTVAVVEPGATDGAGSFVSACERVLRTA